MRMRFSKTGKVFELIFTEDEFYLALDFLRGIHGDTLRDEALVDQVRNRLERKTPQFTVIDGGKE